MYDSEFKDKALWVNVMYNKEKMFAIIIIFLYSIEVRNILEHAED